MRLPLLVRQIHLVKQPHSLTQPHSVRKPNLGEHKKKTLQNFGHMSKLGLPYVPCTLTRTQKSLDKYSSVYATLHTQKIWAFWNQSFLYFLILSEIRLNAIFEAIPN